MKDFKSYDPHGGDPPEKGGGADGGIDKNSAVEIAAILSRAAKGKNENQLLAQILAEAERGKRAGTLTNDDLDNFYKALSPLLDGFKKRKLQEIIARLKKI